jgi:ABC-type sugar transport system ATPase subunit
MAVVSSALSDVANLSKSQPGTSAFEGSSMTIVKGEIHSLLGTNGGYSRDEFNRTR